MMSRYLRLSVKTFIACFYQVVHVYLIFKKKFSSMFIGSYESASRRLPGVLKGLDVQSSTDTEKLGKGKRSERKKELAAKKSPLIDDEDEDEHEVHKPPHTPSSRKRMSAKTGN